MSTRGVPDLMPTGGRVCHRAPAVVLLLVLGLLIPALCPAEPHTVLVPPGPGRGNTLDAGVFLVAGRDLDDPNFSRTVVLLIRYGQDGAMGVVVNRRSGVRLAQLLPDMDGLAGRDDAVYIGGPVERHRITLLIRSPEPPQLSQDVFDDVYVSGSTLTLQALIDDADRRVDFHAYAGYAGWAPGQLDREVERGDWILVGGDAQTVFETEPEEIWPRLIRSAAGTWVREQPGRRIFHPKPPPPDGPRVSPPERGERVVDANSVPGIAGSEGSLGSNRSARAEPSYPTRVLKLRGGKQAGGETGEVLPQVARVAVSG